MRRTARETSAAIWQVSCEVLVRQRAAKQSCLVVSVSISHELCRCCLVTTFGGAAGKSCTGRLQLVLQSLLAEGNVGYEHHMGSCSDIHAMR